MFGAEDCFSGPVLVGGAALLGAVLVGAVAAGTSEDVVLHADRNRISAAIAREVVIAITWYQNRDESSSRANRKLLVTFDNHRC